MVAMELDTRAVPLMLRSPVPDRVSEGDELTVLPLSVNDAVMDPYDVLVDEGVSVSVVLLDPLSELDSRADSLSAGLLDDERVNEGEGDSFEGDGVYVIAE